MKKRKFDPKRVKKYRDRACRVNDLLRVIASCGRRFFSEASEYHKDEKMVGRVSCIEVDDKLGIFLVSSWRGRRISLRGPYYQWRDRGFHQGGTLQSLVQALVGFIRTGKPIGGFFGPFPSYMCEGDPWAYGKKNMEHIEREAQRLGIRPSESGYDEQGMSSPVYKYGVKEGDGLCVGDVISHLSKMPNNMPVVLGAGDHNYRLVQYAGAVMAHEQEDHHRPYGEYGGEEAEKDCGPKKHIFLIS